MLNILSTIAAFFATKFAYLFTAVSGVFNTILNEIPDDEITILHGAMNASLQAIQSGSSAEDAFTAGLNYFESAEVGEGKKLLTQLLQAFVTATAPKTGS